MYQWHPSSAFTPAHWWLYSYFVALPIGWGMVAAFVGALEYVVDRWQKQSKGSIRTDRLFAELEAGLQ